MRTGSDRNWIDDSGPECLFCICMAWHVTNNKNKTGTRQNRQLPFQLGIHLLNHHLYLSVYMKTILDIVVLGKVGSDAHRHGCLLGGEEAHIPTPPTQWVFSMASVRNLSISGSESRLLKALHEQLPPKSSLPTCILLCNMA